MGGGEEEDERVVPRLEMASLPIPDELLGEILLRLPTPADLVRFSAGCVSFRRVAADRAFLRRYRKLHAPPLLGFLDLHNVFYPATPPHPSAPAASAVALAADFSFSFLPAGEWVVQDIRDGRVLLDRTCYQTPDFVSITAFTEIVVCDPLHRRYLLLPPMPVPVLGYPCHAFLVPSAASSDKEEAAEETTFRVIWMTRRGENLVAHVFSSTIGQWEDGPSQSWRDSFSGLLKLPGVPNFPQYAHGCFYWVTDCRENLLVLDTQRMEFSVADSPSEVKGFVGVDTAIVEAGKGRPGMFLRRRFFGPDISYIVRHNNSWSSSQWEKTASLDRGYSIIGSTGRQLFLENNRNYFSLDVKTLQLVMVCASTDKCGILWPRPYSNFPPSLLSLPTVASGVEEGAEKVMLEQGCAASSSSQSPQTSK